MDRNSTGAANLTVPTVALRKESVDRNMLFWSFRPVVGVALRKESVDRNSTDAANLTVPTTSLSARRAWIEITNFYSASLFDLVALRKESVDRNSTDVANLTVPTTSLSARRAWIEIPAGCWRDARRASLSARRAWIEIHSAAIRLAVLSCRSPQGERG